MSYFSTSGQIVTSGATQSGILTGEVSLDVNGRFKINGEDLTNLAQRLETIEKRLAILTPDPQKLAQFETLRRLYEQYQMVNALCESQEGAG
jgi:hypothetical protein